MSSPGPQVLRVQFGREMRRLRLAAGVTSREEVAKVLGNSLTKVSKIEQGQATLTAAEVGKLVKLFGISGEEAQKFRELAAAARKRGSYGKVPAFGRSYVGMEADASELKVFSSELIPGWLQIEAYARAIISTSVTAAPADIERLVETRVNRGVLLTKEEAPAVNVILGEACLHRRVGGTQTLREQLQHLLSVALLPNVTLQILPFTSGEHAGMGTEFTLLRPRGIDAEYVYLEDLTSADFWDRPPHTQVYAMVFNKLQITAFGERESMTSVQQRIQDLDEGPAS